MASDIARQVTAPLFSLLGVLLGAYLAQRWQQQTRGDFLLKAVYEARMAAYNELAPRIEAAFIVFLSELEASAPGQLPSVVGTPSHAAFLGLRLKTVEYLHLLPPSVLEAADELHKFRSDTLQGRNGTSLTDLSSSLITKVQSLRAAIRVDARAEHATMGLASITPTQDRKELARQIDDLGAPPP
jgi:hypothetical protein